MPVGWGAVAYNPALNPPNVSTFSRGFVNGPHPYNHLAAGFGAYQQPVPYGNPIPSEGDTLHPGGGSNSAALITHEPRMSSAHSNGNGPSSLAAEPIGSRQNGSITRPPAQAPQMDSDVYVHVSGNNQPAPASADSLPPAAPFVPSIPPNTFVQPTFQTHGVSMGPPAASSTFQPHWPGGATSTSYKGHPSFNNADGLGNVPSAANVAPNRHYWYPDPLHQSAQLSGLHSAMLTMHQEMIAGHAEILSSMRNLLPPSLKPAAVKPTVDPATARFKTYKKVAAAKQHFKASKLRHHRNGAYVQGKSRKSRR